MPTGEGMQRLPRDEVPGDLLFELNRECGTTLILVTHDLGLAARCGRRLNIDAGVVSTEEHQQEMAM